MHAWSPWFIMLINAFLTAFFPKAMRKGVKIIVKVAIHSDIFVQAFNIDYTLFI